MTHLLLHKTPNSVSSEPGAAQAELAWVAIQVVPELQTFNAYFGTIAQIEEVKERFSIRMKPEYTIIYERLGSEDEFDPSLRPEWSNGGYLRLRFR
jgi:hypothetical protein